MSVLCLCCVWCVWSSVCGLFVWCVCGVCVWCVCLVCVGVCCVRAQGGAVRGRAEREAARGVHHARRGRLWHALRLRAHDRASSAPRPPLLVLRSSLSCNVLFARSQPPSSSSSVLRSFLRKQAKDSSALLLAATDSCSRPLACVRPSPCHTLLLRCMSSVVPCSLSTNNQTNNQTTRQNTPRWAFPSLTCLSRHRRCPSAPGPAGPGCRDLGAGGAWLSQTRHRRGGTLSYVLFLMLLFPWVPLSYML